MLFIRRDIDKFGIYTYYYGRDGMIFRQIDDYPYYEMVPSVGH